MAMILSLLLEKREYSGREKISLAPIVKLKHYNTTIRKFHYNKKNLIFKNR
jgi:hypothetical protein